MAEYRRSDRTRQSPPISLIGEKPGTEAGGVAPFLNEANDSVGVITIEVEPIEQDESGARQEGHSS